jgi:hypothetical protein
MNKNRSALFVLGWIFVFLVNTADAKNLTECKNQCINGDDCLTYGPALLPRIKEFQDFSKTLDGSSVISACGFPLLKQGTAILHQSQNSCDWEYPLKDGLPAMLFHFPANLSASVTLNSSAEQEEYVFVGNRPEIIFPELHDIYGGRLNGFLKYRTQSLGQTYFVWVFAFENNCFSVEEF